MDLNSSGRVTERCAILQENVRGHLSGFYKDAYIKLNNTLKLTMCLNIFQTDF